MRNPTDSDEHVEHVVLLGIWVLGKRLQVAQRGTVDDQIAQCDAASGVQHHVAGRRHKSHMRMRGEGVNWLAGTSGHTSLSAHLTTVGHH